MYVFRARDGTEKTGGSSFIVCLPSVVRYKLQKPSVNDAEETEKKRSYVYTSI